MVFTLVKSSDGTNPPSIPTTIDRMIKCMATVGVMEREMISRRCGLSLNTCGRRDRSNKNENANERSEMAIASVMN
jgi:hypothetical protein